MTSWISKCIKDYFRFPDSVNAGIILKFLIINISFDHISIYDDWLNLNFYKDWQQECLCKETNVPFISDRKSLLTSVKVYFYTIAFIGEI